MNLLGFCGSLREVSTNKQVLLAAQLLCADNVDLLIEDEIGNLPQFNPDISINSDRRLVSFVERVKACNGLIVSSPVYAGGYPGSLKNALDWLVGTDAFVEKPFMMLSTSNRVPAVERTLVKVLETMSGKHIANASITIHLLGSSLSAEQIISDKSKYEVLSASLSEFVGAILE